MADTYTRDQIARKLRGLKKRYLRGIVTAKAMKQMESYKAYVCMIASLDEAIAAFPPKKRGSK